MLGIVTATTPMQRRQLGDPRRLAASVDNQSLAWSAYTCSFCCRPSAVNLHGGLEIRTDQTVHYATKDIYKVSPQTLAGTCEVCHA